MAKGNIYRLNNGKTPQSWSLKQDEVGINTPDGFKFINYFPGSTSIFVDDEINKNRKTERVHFEFNDLDATEIIVPVENILLNKYMKAHPHFNVHYELFSEEISAERQLADFDKKEEALMAIRETNDLKIQATAMAINGMESFGWEALKCKAWLKEKALTDPDTILSKINAAGYESRYIAALAFYSGIVKEDLHKTKVTWNDETAGTILHLAKGEFGIVKLGEMLSVNDNESRLVLQEIGKRVDSGVATPSKSEAKVDTSVLDAKDAEIAALKAQLAAKPEPQPESELAKVTEEDTKNVDKAPEVEPTIEELQALYVEKFKKEVPPAFKNKVEWLKEKVKN